MLLMMMLLGCFEYGLHSLHNDVAEAETILEDTGVKSLDENQDSDSVEEPQEDPILLTDTDAYPEPSDVDTDAPADTDHPTMDEFGNPLYPIINPDFEDTGVAPDPRVSRSLEDCFSDNDGDGYYGLEIHTVPTVDCPLQGRPNDCNDSDARVNPGQVEIPCNHIDENCDSTDMN